MKGNKTHMVYSINCRAALACSVFVFVSNKDWKQTQKLEPNKNTPLKSWVI